MSTEVSAIEELANREYKYGFVTEIEAESLPPGLNEEVIRAISAKKREPDFLLEWRLKAYRSWLKMEDPAHRKPSERWAKVQYPPIDYQGIIYYSAPKKRGEGPKSLEEVDPKLLETYNKLGIPLKEQERLAGVAVDAVFDSVSVATTFKGKLAELGILFCSFSEAVQEHPDLVRKYLGSVVPYNDNFDAALNSAVFSDGSFVYVPPGVRCPMELSTYFRINAANTGQFERTLIIADEGAYVSYLEGCLPAGEQVSVGDRWVNIESLKSGDYVVADNGRKARVRAAMTRPYRGEMLTVHPISPYNAFRLTPEHPALAVRRAEVLKKRRPRNGWMPEVDTQKLLAAEPQYVPAGELEVGDFLVFPKVHSEGHNPKYTPELLKLLGYYLAEGSTYVNKALNMPIVSFSFGANETDLIDEVVSLTQQVAGKRAYVTQLPDKHAVNVSVYSQKLMDLCIAACGKGAAAKCLSEEVMALPPEQIEPLLEAYFKGDGNVCNKGNSVMHRAATASEALARQLQELLARKGIFASIQIRRGGEDTIQGRTIHRQDQYIVVYTADKRWSEVRTTEGYFLVPIKQVEREPYDGLVFNVDVEGPNSYLVRGFAVHNCTAPMRDENQLHAAVVELVALENAQIKYSTVQNWYPGDKDGKGGIYNFVTKRGACRGRNSKISWTQVETGSAITWKYPSVILQGDNSVGEFYSVAVTANRQQADTGTKMIHMGKNTRSTIVSKGISAGHGQNTYRGAVTVLRGAANARNYTQCDSLLIGSACGAHTFPYIDVRNTSSQVEHEASTSKIGEDQIFYCNQRGISKEDAVSMIVNGFCKQVLQNLPMEFAVEAQKLLGISLEGSVG
jgi:Fe-S cluster assembly protein SufB